MTMRVILIFLWLAAMPLAAMAQSVQDSIVAQLQSQGFDNLTITRTWLGRVRIVALSDELRREIVFNPNSGEILRDYWEQLNGQSDQGGQILLAPVQSDGDQSDNGDPGAGNGDANDEGGSGNGGDDSGGDDGGNVDSGDVGGGDEGGGDDDGGDVENSGSGGGDESGNTDDGTDDDHAEGSD